MNFQEKIQALVDRKADEYSLNDVSGPSQVSELAFYAGAVDPLITKAIELNAYLGFIQQIIDDFTIRGLPTDYWEEKRIETQRDLDKILDGGE